MSESHEAPEMTQRRELLRRAAWLLGGAVSAPAALAFLQGCTRKDAAPAASRTATVLSAPEMTMIAAIADVMIPKTDTAGALDAQVQWFIDSALGAVYPEADRERFKAGLAEFGTSEVTEARVGQAIEAALAAGHGPRPFILMMRELTLLGYFSSRVGITENMEYVPVPTAFHGCVPLSQMSKHVYWE